MARSRLFDVFGNECRHIGAGPALCVDQQSQFRGAAGTRRTHASRESDDGRGGGNQGALY